MQNMMADSWLDNDEIQAGAIYNYINDISGEELENNDEDKSDHGSNENANAINQNQYSSVNRNTHNKR
jgi:hypothetical protein